MHDRRCRVWIEKAPGITTDESGESSVGSDGVEYIVYDSLDVKFNITLDASGWINQGVISVCNLNQKTIVHYMKNIGLLDWSGRRHIRLEAGYADGAELGLIFSGRIMKCQPTIAPDVWLNFIVMSDELSMQDKYIVSGKTVNSVLNNLATGIGISYNDSGWLVDAKPSSEFIYSAAKKFSDHKKTLEAKLRGVPELRNKYYPILSVYNGQLLVLDGHSKDNNPMQGRIPAVTISDEYMIGVPQLDWPNVTITTFLNTKYKCFQNAQLQMGKTITDGRYNSFAIGKKYFILKLTHQGHLRGEPWITTLHLVDCSNNKAKTGDSTILPSQTYLAQENK